MPVTDAQSGGTVFAVGPKVPVTLNGTVSKGDLLAPDGTGYVRADADLAAGPLVPVLVALEDGVSADVIIAAEAALVSGHYSGGTKGAALYASGTAGKVTETKPTTVGDFAGKVGHLVAADLALLHSVPYETKTLYVSHIIDIAGTAVDVHFFVANRTCVVKDIVACPRVAGTDAGAVSATVTRCQGTEAPASGDDLLGTTKIDLKGTADTVQDPALTATTASLILSAGNRLAVDVTGTLTSVVCVVTVELEII